MHVSEFIKRFPGANIGSMPWAKGQTKKDNPSLLKLSETLKSKKIWNFTKWRKEMNKQRADRYSKLSRSENLAELIGIILGDGNLNKHSRTENLRITCNSEAGGYIKHVSSLMEKIFYKPAAVRKRKNENAVSIDLYQCRISQRLGLPCGNKIRNNVGVPSWIIRNENYFVRCLKGLFETDGCFNEDKDN